MITKTEQPTVSIPVTIPQIAEGLRRLSRTDLETLEILLNEKAVKIIEESRIQAKRGKVRELKVRI